MVFYDRFCEIILGQRWKDMMSPTIHSITPVVEGKK